jgi:hypothetical protein
MPPATDPPGEYTSEPSAVADGPIQPTYPLFHGAGISSKLADLEAVLGLTLVGFTTLMVVIGIPVFTLQLLIYHRPRLPNWYWAVLGPPSLAAVYLQWKSFQAIGSSLEHAAHPRPVSMALSQRTWPVALRPLVGLWWLGQAAMFVAIAEQISRGLQIPNPSDFGRILILSMRTVLIFMSVYCGTCAILIALASLGASPWLVKFVWRIRILIDLIVATLITTAITRWASGG